MAPIKIPDKQLTELRAFITLLKSQPGVLHQPELQFFKEYIECLGGKIPAPEKQDIPKSCPAHESHQKTSAPAAEEEAEPELVESDVELDETGVIEPDNDAPQEMGDANKMEVTEEEEEKLSEHRQQATEAFGEGDYEKAANAFTEAIKINPQSALLFAKRANCYIHLNKPNACIRDCNRAIELNPDSASGHKFRGRAHRLLGNWEEAVKDLRLACKIDYDDQANDWLKEVTPNAKKLEEHRRKYERLREEKLLREKQARIKRAQEEHQRAREEASRSSAGANPFAGMGGMPGMGGMGGMPGMGGMGGMPDIGSLLNDPEVLAAFQDPEVAQAFQDISSNPQNYSKYENNPKIKSVINKMASKFGGGMGGMGGMGGGFPGGFPGGFGGFPGDDSNDVPGGADDLD